MSEADKKTQSGFSEGQNISGTTASFTGASDTAVGFSGTSATAAGFIGASDTAA
ncbi:MAG TPA: hypothetical protein GXZ59_01635, partial [Clostridiaceae bacterium]|nr:hypothetical protein [Clostridiaceae bacterium]